MSHTGQKVAIITGGSQGIGASLVAAYRRQGWSVVATARTMKPTGDPDVLTIDGDIAARDCLLKYKSNGRVLAVASIYRDLASLHAELAMEQKTMS